ncbi:MAG: hypothetical protein WC100_19315 [Sterolibacterium sp.]
MSGDNFNIVGMTDKKLLEVCGRDHSRWAYAFCQAAAMNGTKVDPDLASIWFANAMMAATERSLTE